MNSVEDHYLQPAHHQRLGQRWALLLASGLVAVSMALFALSNLTTGIQLSFWISALCSLWAGVVLIYVYHYRNLGKNALAFITVLLVAPLYLAVWVRHVELGRLDVLWSPFQGLKLVVLGLGVIVPGPYWVNILLILGFAVESALIWQTFDLSQNPNVPAANEPMLTVIFFLVAFGLLAFRWQHEVLERRLMAAVLRARVLSTIAHVFLRVRDQANTPLQNLKLGLALLEMRGHGSEDTTERMRRAIDRITELNGEFSRYESAVEWSGEELQEDAVERWLRSQTDQPVGAVNQENSAEPRL